MCVSEKVYEKNNLIDMESLNDLWYGNLAYLLIDQFHNFISHVTPAAEAEDLCLGF